MHNHQQQTSSQTENGNLNQRQATSDAVDRLLKQAEISRLTRNLKSKLALASLKTQKSPTSTPTSGVEQRRRAKTLEGAIQSPRPNDTPGTRPRPGSRRSSVTSVSSVSSRGSTSSMASPRARISRISSVNSITEANHEELQINQALQSDRASPSRSNLLVTQGSNGTPQRRTASLTGDDRDPLPKEPQTPPSTKRAYPKTPERSSTSDGANLLLHFAHSPGRATPRTPDFNMNDYLHFQTPSPARGGQLTPRQMRWGSLNSALFQPTGLVSTSKLAGSDFDNEPTH